MATEINNSAIPVPADGLDRTKITSSGEVELVSVPSASSTDSDQSEDDARWIFTPLSRGVKPKSKRKRLLLKTKEKLHIGENEPAPRAPVLADARDAHSDSRLGEKPPEPKKHSAKDLLHHPVSTIQSKATGQGGHQIASNLVAKEISHGTDVGVVIAQAKVGKPGTQKEVKAREHDVKLLLKERQDMYVRWTMDRHVTNVRILPVDTVPKRTKNDFKKITTDGLVKTDWEAYIRHVRLATLGRIFVNQQADSLDGQI